MSALYMILVIILVVYKIILNIIFKSAIYSQDKEDVSQDLKKWKFNLPDILYYLATICAIIYPLIDYKITLSLFVIGSAFILFSLILYIYSLKSSDNRHALLIDLFFVEGLAMQSNSWIVGILGFLHFIISVLKTKKLKNP